MKFQETLNLLTKEKKNLVVQECIQHMTYGTVLFNEGFTQDKEKLASLYSLRLNLAKKFNRNKLDESEIKYWEIAVENLNVSEALKLRLNWISSEEKTYFAFWDINTKNLDALFYLKSVNSIIQQEKNFDLSVKRGYSVSEIKFYQGKKVKDWNQD